MSRLVLVALLVLGGAGVAAWISWGRAEAGAGEEDPGGLYVVRRADLEITITENGTLVAKESRKVVMGAKRRGQIAFLVEEGKRVEEGEVLVRCETAEIEREIEQGELEVVQSEADLATSKTKLDIEKSDGASKIEKSRIALDKAKKELERYLQGDAPQERRKLEIAIKDARTKFNRAEKKLADSRALWEKRYILKSELENDEIDYEKAEVELASAQLALDLFERYTFPMTQAEKEVSVREAEREAQNAELRASSELRQAEVAVRKHEKRLKRQKTKLEELKKNLDGMTLKAPCPGIVIYGDPRQPWWRSEIKIGGHLWPGATVVTIPDLRVMQVKLSIHEADIDKIKVEQDAVVTMDTYAGLVIPGKVTKIAAIAGNPDNGEDEVKEFDVEITLDYEAEDRQLKPGISAKGVISIERLKDVLFVPIQCVFSEEGQSLAYVLDGAGTPQRREVQVGLNNDNYVVVTDGLAEGEQVLLYNPNLPGSRARGEEEGEASEEAAAGGAGEAAAPATSEPIEAER